MPGITAAQIAAWITETAGLAVTDGISRFSTLSSLFGFKPASNADNVQLQAIAESGNSSAGTFTPGSGYPAADADEFVYPVQGWASIAATFDVNDQLLRKIDLAERGGQAKFNGYMSAQLEGAIKAAMQTLETGIISGTGAANTILGLTYWIAASNNIAGVDRAVHTNFGCHVDTTGGALSAATLENGLAYWRHVVGPDMGRLVALCDYKQLRRMKALTSAAFVAAPQQVGESIRLGFSGVALEGGQIPVIGIPGYTGGRVDIINLDAIGIEVLGNPAQPFEVDLDAVRAQGSDVYSYSLRGYMQLALQNPRKNAMAFTGLTDS